MTWGWLVAMIGIQCVAMSMAELCSSMPTSGGLYYAAAVLAPPGYGPFAAWITGWSNWLAQVTAAPSGMTPNTLSVLQSLTSYI
jgi:amino acid transporter